MGKKIWGNSKHEAVDSSGTVHHRDEWCEVRIGDGEIEIRYEDNEGRMVRYLGKEVRQDCFELRAERGCIAGSLGTPGNPGHTELHLFRVNDELYLEGSWGEGTAQGMWYIALG